MSRACLALGLALLALVWLGPLLGAYRESFAAHMLAHMGVVAIAAPLLAIGISFAPRAGGLARALRGGGTKAGEKLRKVEETAALRSLPILASLVELVVVWLWHAPSMRALAESSTVATSVEQAGFLAAGLFLWTACLADDRSGRGAFGLLLTSVHMTLLGALLALAPRPLYGSGDVTCFGVTLTAGQDQQVGGVLMLLIGAAVYLAGGVALLARMLNDPPRPHVHEAGPAS